MTDLSKKRRHILLSFAHRGEAKSFLQEFKWNSLTSEGDLYTIESSPFSKANLSLVITGEGRDQVLVKLTRALTKLQSQWPEENFHLLNLGVCGHLKNHPQNFSRQDLILLKTCYAQRGEENQEMEFKSFSCDNSLFENDLKEADCVSTNIRVLNSKHALHLSHFAPLVDREVWAVGLVAQITQTPFSSLKVISDFADGDICARVKEDTEIWSDLLLKSTLTLLKTVNDGGKSVIDENLWPELKEHLHITVSQERRLRLLLKALSLKGKSKELILKETKFTDLIQEDLRPKDKTKIFLESLADLLNPLDKKLRLELEELTTDLKEAGLKVRFDQGHENEVLHFTTSIDSELQINKVVGALEGFDFQKFRSLVRGQWSQSEKESKGRKDLEDGHV